MSTPEDRAQDRPGAAAGAAAGQAAGGGAAPAPGGAAGGGTVPAPGAAAGAAAAGGGPGRRGRELGAVVLLCAAGGGLTLFAAGRPWLRIAAERQPPLPDVSLALTGRDLEPLVTGLGIAGLAGVVGLLATRRLGRLAVATVLVLAGVGVLAGALSRLGTPGDAEIAELLTDSGRTAGTAAATASAAPGWPLLAAAGGLLLALGGTLALVRSRRWPTMSSRYEKPAARGRAARPQTDAARWDALDRGDDWTTADPAPPEPRPGT